MVDNAKQQADEGQLHPLDIEERLHLSAIFPADEVRCVPPIKRSTADLLPEPIYTNIRHFQRSIEHQQFYAQPKGSVLRWTSFELDYIDHIHVAWETTSPGFRFRDSVDCNIGAPFSRPMKRSSLNLVPSRRCLIKQKIPLDFGPTFFSTTTWIEIGYGEVKKSGTAPDPVAIARPKEQEWH